MKLQFGYMLLSGLLVSAPALAQPKPAAFGTCAGCHTVVKGAKPGIGPNLFAIGGRRAGTAPNFRFSAPMAKSGIAWTRENLVRFIQKPQKTVPGTKMAFGGVSNPASAAAIADYLLATK